MGTGGARHGCSCGLLPCICVQDEGCDYEELQTVAVDAQDDSSASDAKRAAGSGGSARAQLRQLFAANATAECSYCMMLPCICPAEDDMNRDDETTSVEAATPPGSDHGLVEEESDEYGRVRLRALAADQEAGKSAERAATVPNEVWIAREIKQHLKRHQVEGIQFLFDHVRAERGCILADYMGLGKTLQVVTVIHSFMADHLAAQQNADDQNCDHPTKVNATSGQSDTEPAADPITTMVLCPAICIPNWESEFKKWLSSESQELCPIFALDSSTGKGTTAGRIRFLQKWKRQGGVLLVGYEMYRSLLNPTLTASFDRDPVIQVCTRVGSSTMEVTDSLSTKTQKAAREFHRLLCSPGADLVVLDEGHRMKDPSSLLCQSVEKIRTPRRLVLTGYPVQNSLSEYWCMVNFARKNFLGSYDEFRSRYEKPIVEGDAGRSEELIVKLQDVVLRRGKALLNRQLPPKMEWILYCKLSPLQHRLYCAFLDYYGESEDGKASADLLTAYAALLQVMNHPDIIYSKLCPQDDDADRDDDTEQLEGLGEEGEWAWESEERLLQKKQQAAQQQRKRRQKIADRQKSYEWARPVVFGRSLNNLQCSKLQSQPQVVEHDTTPCYRTEMLENSGKMAVLMHIIAESFACGDKVVVFSQSVPTLKVISDFLRVSDFNPNRETDIASKTELQASRGNKFKRRKTSAHPKRDPAGIVRKRASQNDGPAKRQLTSSAVSSREWFLQIDGGTSGAKRMEYIQHFSSSGSSVKLLLVSTRAGAEGINLHAANRLVLFDVSWNPSNDHQSMCRSHRIGQAKPVHVYRLVSTGTMERMIYEQQMKKVDLSTAVVDNKRKEGSVSSTTTPGSAPFSGFLLTPPPPDPNQKLSIDGSVVDADPVLVSCVDKLAHWLVDVQPVREALDDGVSPTKE